MKTLKFFFAGLFMWLIALLSFAGDNIKRTPVYMIGYGFSISDSIAYMTGVQKVDTAYIDKKTGFLLSRNMFSLQLQQYLADKKQMGNMTCAVFFGEKKKAMEKKLAKLTRLYMENENMKMNALDASDFHFQIEPFVPPVEKPKAPKQKGKKGKNKKK